MPDWLNTAVNGFTICYVLTGVLTLYVVGKLVKEPLNPIIAVLLFVGWPAYYFHMAKDKPKNGR